MATCLSSLKYIYIYIYIYIYVLTKPDEPKHEEYKTGLRLNK